MTVVRHVNPVAYGRARGPVAEVYRQVDAEFSTVGAAVLMTSPAPEILAPGWALLRETRLAGAVPVVTKAVVGLGVAQANRCGYDELAYLAALETHGSSGLAEQLASGGVPDDPEHAELLAWARASGSDPSSVKPAPYPSETACEIIGSVLFTHYINRMLMALLPPDASPESPDGEEAVAYRELPKQREPGASLALLDDPALSLVERPVAAPDWAAGSPIGIAYATLKQAAAMGAGLLSAGARETVDRVIAGHRGRIQFDYSSILDDGVDELSEVDELGARVAILSGLAPSELTDADVAAWRATDRHFSDHCTVFLLAYGAMTAVGHIEADLTETG